ncbi:Oxoglutarate/iron-dependent dioxygenase [Macleaya cordata]|uniref:2-oxoglutarate-dependent dioxygenase DAO n=1 Tax=Macleaya cordata TaxID=56857 RepID=A0A200PN66_MACCD|nr:Oxoglutarate/iron-dependent dioxygenase [Macleaya cordata]
MSERNKNPKDLEEGSEGWKKLCKEVREACEEYGYFQVVYEKIPMELHDEMFVGLKDLFDLPLETKQKNKSIKPFYGYIGRSLPLYESLGIEDSHNLDQVQAFTDLMWPNKGNPAFCQTLNQMSKMMQELEQIIRKMVFESYGAEKHCDSNIEESEVIFRVMKYKTTHSNEDSAVGLGAHSDNNILTILYQDVEGLEILSREGEWFPLRSQQGVFTVFVGQALKAWSNGRLHAARHQVMMRGSKERYSYALFAEPKMEAVVEVPMELVDKDHPLLFRPFQHKDFLRFFYSNRGADNSLEDFAGIIKGE